MLRIDGRVLVGSVAGVFLVGALLGLAAGSGALPGIGGSGATSTGPAEPTPAPAAPTPVPTPNETPPPTATRTTPATALGTATATPTATPTVAATSTAAPTVAPTPTPTLTPTPTATATATATPVPTRTPMLIRRFDVAKIERELRRLINEWRSERGLDRFEGPDGRIVDQLEEMAYDHSVAMADLGETVHTIDNQTSAERFREYDLYRRCMFRKANASYLVTAEHNRLELVARTYAGRAVETKNGTRYNANETAVARAIFEDWTRPEPFRQRLAYVNATRIGIGIELTRNNEVYVTGAVCGASPDPAPNG
ncbi:MAG: CAP domain-containing protein [Haloarculaceae archaeon]